MTSKFKRLLGNLPFNPSLIGKVAFYAKRLRRESSIRRLGFTFVVLAMFIQTFAVLSPPQPSIAQSGNDLIEGGFTSQSQAVSVCQNNVGSYRDIAGYFNITCDNIAAAHTVTIHSTDYNRQLYSMGRIAYGKAGETPIAIKGTTYWLRYLWSWDSLGYPSTYQALQGTSREGRTFFILYDCGNLVFIGLPPPPTPVCVWNPSILANDPYCLIPQCPYDKTIPITDSRCGACPYDQSISKTSTACVQCPNPRYPNVTALNPACKPICPYNNSLDKDNPACKPCEEAQTITDKTACLELSKKARNDTQNIDDANGTTAKAGDIITYTLTIKNKGKADIDKYVIQENISDILDYADVVDLKGGSQDSHNIVSWPARKIKAGQTTEQQFIVKVKSPIPQTPVSSSDPGHFDLTMTNVYGNAVSIKLPPSIMKTTETIVGSLPNTGPGKSLVIGFSLTALIGYFFLRTRLMYKELELVRSEYNTSGGM